MECFEEIAAIFSTPFGKSTFAITDARGLTVTSNFESRVLAYDVAFMTSCIAKRTNEINRVFRKSLFFTTGYSDNFSMSTVCTNHITKNRRRNDVHVAFMVTSTS